MKKYLCVCVVFYFVLSLSGCGGGGGSSAGNGDASTTTEETAALKAVTTSVEDAFLSGIPTNVLNTMSDEFKAFYEDEIDTIKDKMVSFGNDFKTRKLVYASDNYAEYEFTADNLTFTVTFSRQEDGTWKLTRF